MCVLSFSLLIFELSLLSLSLDMCARCHRIDIIIEFPLSRTRAPVLSNEGKKKEKKTADRQKLTDARTRTHVYMYTNVCMCLCARERDDDCHISDNVVRCSYNSRISLSLDILNEMSEKKPVIVERCTRILLY